MTREDAATLRLAADQLWLRGRWNEGAKTLATKLQRLADTVDASLDR